MIHCSITLYGTVAISAPARAQSIICTGFLTLAQIISVFIRTDYVRFNHSNFEKEERKQIVETLEESIKILENVRGENV